MQINLIIACPFCCRGYAWQDEHANKGWLRVRCTHCREKFYNKTTIIDVKVQTKRKLPVDMRYHTLPEAK